MAPRRFIGELKSGTATLRRRRRIWGLVTLGLPVALALIGSFVESRVPGGGELVDPSSLTPVWWRSIVGLGAIVTLFAAVRWAYDTATGTPIPMKEVRVVVDEDALIVAGKGEPVTYARSEIINVFEDQGRVGVTLRDGRTLSFSTDEPGTLGKLQRALAPDPRRDRSRIPIGGVVSSFSAARMITWWVFLVSLLVVFSLTLAISGNVGAIAQTGKAWAIATAFATSLWLLLRRREVVVGSDGLWVRGLIADRFVPHEAIERVASFSDGKVVVHHSGGKKLRLPATPQSASLAARIEEARAIPRGQAPPLDGLERGERDGPKWREAIDALTSDRSYRAGAFRVEDAEATLADPGASPEARVGAAIALRDRAPEKIRVAVESTADADLAAALEAAAEGEVAERRLRRAQRRHDRA